VNRRKDSAEAGLSVQPILNGNSELEAQSIAPLQVRPSPESQSSVTSNVASPCSEPIASSSSASNVSANFSDSPANAALSADIRVDGNESEANAKQSACVKQDGVSSNDASCERPIETQMSPTDMMRKDDESLPSFDEWKKRVLEEEQPPVGEAPRIDPAHIITAAVGGQVKDDKIRIRNYASAECGAKVLSSNSEAEGSWKMLQESFDEYMLNPCSANIWFVVELCEPIQLISIQVANYELFSSTFKHFSVYTASHYPNAEWRLVANLQSSDTKSVQLFLLPRQTEFLKFLKVQVNDHYGNEHYCPFSLIRVFGVSMVEELDALEQKPNHFAHQTVFYPTDSIPITNQAHPIAPIVPSSESLTESLPASSDPTKQTSNSLLVSASLLGSARDAVLSVVRKAAFMFGKYSSRSVKTDDSSNMDRSVADLLKDQETIEAIIEQWFMKMLPVLGGQLRHCPSGSLRGRSQTTTLCSYLRYMLGTKTFDLLRKELRKSDTIRFKCDKSQKPNAMHIQSSTIDSNGTNASNSMQTDPKNRADGSSTSNSFVPDAATILVDSSAPANLPINPSVSFSASLVSGASSLDSMTTQPADPIEMNDEMTSKDQSSSMMDVTSVEQSAASSPSSSSSLPTAALSRSQFEALPASTFDTEASEPESNGASSTKAAALDSSSADNGNESHQVSNNKQSGSSVDSNPSVAAPVISGQLPAHHGQMHLSPISASQSKESVFVRMSNKIRALELNLSLSSQYLEELSQRYRRQMDEMQRNFNQTVFRLNETARLAAEKDNRQQVLLDRLGSRIQQLELCVYSLVFLVLARLVMRRLTN
jgi:hypothetical protein